MKSGDGGDGGGVVAIAPKKVWTDSPLQSDSIAMGRVSSGDWADAEANSDQYAAAASAVRPGDDEPVVVTVRRADHSEFDATLLFDPVDHFGTNFKRPAKLDDLKRGTTIAMLPKAAGGAAGGAGEGDRRGEVVKFHSAHWQRRGANMWVERYDTLWIGIGYGMLLGLSLLVPFAAAFNVQFVLWLFWGAMLLVGLSVRTMQYTNGNIGRRGGPFMRFSHVKFIGLLLIVTFRPAFSATFLGDWHLSLTLSCLQLVALVAFWWWRPSRLVPIAMMFIALQLAGDVLVALGDHSSSSLATLDFALSTLVLAATYLAQTPHMWLRRRLGLADHHFACHHMSARVSECSCVRGMSSATARRLFDQTSGGREHGAPTRGAATPAPLSATAKAQHGFMSGLRSLRRVAVVTTFFNLLIMSPAITNHQCGTHGWGAEWALWMGVVAVVGALSYRVSPLVPGGTGSAITNQEQLQQQRAGMGHFYGQHDEFISSLTILFVNIFFAELVACAPASVGGGARAFLTLASTLLVSFTFLVALRWTTEYAPFSAVEIATTLAGRATLIVAALACLTALVTSAGFGGANYIRELSGCLKTISRQHDSVLGLSPNETSYQPLRLGLAPGFNASATTTLRFNESLLVGLHNSYHQRSPLAGVVQSWDYSHPVFYEQLQLGYREIEIDVHWRKNSVDWRVFHVLMLDQGSSCTCLASCLSGIRSWMDAHAGHTPILVHIEPRGYKYNDLFCERADGRQRFEQMQQLLFDLFSDRIYFPDQLTAGFPSAHAALTQRGWPRVADMRGKIVFNLNLFSSNAACKPLYFSMGGASYAKRLEFSDRLAEQWMAADDEARPPTRAAPKAWAEARQRKVFFNRGTIEEAKLSNTTATMEVTSETVAREPWMLHQGFVTRFRIGNAPEDSATILNLHKIFPSTLVSYDGVWAG